MRADGFRLIDGMRGIAALAVVSLHWQAISAPWLYAANGGLAVDLFFLLSGIVIAHAYDDRIANGELNASRFMLIRIIRFWPLYALGTLMGAAAVYVAMATGRDSHYNSYGDLAAAAGLTLLFVPQHWGGSLYQLNTPFWSLLWELVANLAFVLFWRRLSVKVLVAVVAMGALGLITTGMIYGHLPAGSLWVTAATGPIRVMFSFFMGVLIYRTVPRGPVRSTWAGAICAAMLIALFAIRADAWQPFYDLACVLLVFPAAGWLVMRVDVRGATSRLFKALGDASYGVYVLHLPTLIVVSWVASHTGLGGPPLFLACFIALVGGVLALDRWYDRPVRKWMTALGGLKARRPALNPEPL
jgi:peptidoglycan/LPS O-acetylase OafA/YrhL